MPSNSSRNQSRSSSKNEKVMRQSQRTDAQAAVVDLVVRCGKSTVFLTVPENSIIKDVKRKLAPLLKLRISDMHLSRAKSPGESNELGDSLPMEEDRTLATLALRNPPGQGYHN
ncbi:hypothetical protein BV898_01478 [Hypsibius exemplaris]|uniref:Ubiquitin-like domain-containing protein n=1 Tax=Hypsibius exemplaris TaxID=2072580 RepID=A0A1W0XBL5_HYPEX|nr:hypothetical protein BV898_01478 [Hypsibius exemplaris]